MKRILTALLALVLALGVLSGCGGEKELVADGVNVIDVFAGVDLHDGAYLYVRSNKLNGSGHYWVDSLHLDLDQVDYDKANADVKKFLKSIDFYWVEKEEMRETLRNGDTITVGLEYSKSEAEALGITLLEETKTLTVDWLTEPYRDPSEISDEALQEAIDAADPVNWALEELGVECSMNDWCENPSHSIIQRTFYRYKEDGSGEAYISQLLILVNLRFEGDDAVYGKVTNDNAFLFFIPMDRTDDPYGYHVDEDEGKMIDVSVGENWDGRMVFGDIYLEDDGSLVHYKWDEETGQRYVNENWVIEEFNMN